jgi:heme o synthase
MIDHAMENEMKTTAMIARIPKATEQVRQVHISVPHEAIDDLRASLRSTRFPNEQPVRDSSQGVPLAQAKGLVRDWESRCDWPRFETELKSICASEIEVSNVATEALAMGGRPSGLGALADYLALTKPDVNLLILVTTAAGFYLGLPLQAVGSPILLLCHTLLGTLLVASGTATLNQYVEREFDGQMRRTKRRPLAAGRIRPARALWFGIMFSVVGAIYLAVAVNLLASLIAVLTLLFYLLIYTPLKRKTPFCTLVGAFPGAAPPLIGWAAVSGTLHLEAWMLYGMVFLWQFPHFMAIAWMYRDDYARAGYFVLPHDQRRNPLMGVQAVLPAFGLIALSVVPVLLGKERLVNMAACLLLSGFFLYYGIQLAIRKTNTAARRVLLASIVYLPLILLLIVLRRAQ